VAHEGFGGANQLPNDAAVAGHFLFVADDFGLTIYDVNDPTAPEMTSQLLLPEPGLGIALSGSLAFVADGASGLQIIDVGNPSRPVLVGNMDTPDEAEDVAVSGGLALVADLSAGLQIIDITDPSHPAISGSYATYTAIGVAVSGSVAYLADYVGGLKLIDISDPADPTLLGTFSTAHAAAKVVVDGTKAYVAEVTVLEIVDVSTSSNPVLAGTINEGADGIAVSGGLAYLATGSALMIYNVADPSNASYVGFYSTDHQLFMTGVTLSGTTVYTTGLWFGLHIIDAGNPSEPSLLGTFDTRGAAQGVTISGSVAYVADGDAGLQIVDVSHPTAPKLLGSHGTAGPAKNLAVASGVAYLAVQQEGLQIMDVSDPAHPSPIATYDTPGAASDVVVSGNLAYVADSNDGLVILDVSDPSNPALVGSFDTPTFAAVGVALAGNLALVATGNHGLVILDVSDPSHPTLAGSLDTPGWAYAVAVSGEAAYVADSNALQIIDIGSPSDPVLLATYETPGIAVGVAVSGGVAYVSDRGVPHRVPGGLHILDVSDPTSPSLIATVATFIRGSNDVALDPQTSTAWLADEPLLEGVTLSCLSCPAIRAESDPASILAGGETAAITVALADSSGNPLPGQAVTGTTDLGRLSAFTGNGNGTYTATFTSGSDTGTASITVSAGGESCTQDLHVEIRTEAPGVGDPGEHAFMISGAAHISGLAGTNWVSDVVLWNGSAHPAYANLYLLKSGRDNSGAPAVRVTVPAGASLKLGDIVGTTFGESRASGAILVGSDQDLVVTSRTYNAASSGTYGQFIAGVPVAEGIDPDQTARLIQLTRDDDYRTNVGFANASANAIQVKVDLYDGNGTFIKSWSRTIEPYGFYQKTDIFGADVTDGYALVSSPTAGALFFTYASIIDNRTGDPVFITPGAGTASAGESLYIAGSAHVNGAGGTHWRTDVEVHNPGAAEAAYTFELLKRGMENTSPEARSFTLAAGESARFTDILDALFGFTGAAALRVTATAGTVTVTSRTYNQASDGTYGQFIAAVRADESIAAGQAIPIVQLAESASTNSGYRTNIGLVNTSNGSISVHVELHDGDGTLLGTKTVNLRAYEYTQVDRIFHAFTSSTLESCYAVVRTSSTGGSFLAYGSVVDNRSGDPVYVPATGSGGDGSCILTVISPSGGESWTVGSTQQIQWSWQGALCGDTIRAELFKAGQLVSTIREDTPNDGSLSWQIPTDLTPGSGYFIRLTESGTASASDVSDGVFTVQEGS